MVNFRRTFDFKNLIFEFLIFFDLIKISDVRKAVLSNIEVTEETIPYIIERIQDPEPNIRKQVFKQNLQDIDFNYISIESREQILRIGLKDRFIFIYLFIYLFIYFNPRIFENYRDAVVKKACMEMVSENWIKKCDSNILLVIFFIYFIHLTSIHQYLFSFNSF